jgi:tRNA (adenine22-N1)-methyltransferase
VGAGDGQLALELARRGLRVVATERTPASLARLRVAAPGLDYRLGEGLAPLSTGEVEGLVVAGLGGRSIAGLLGRGRPAHLGLRWLVLQPQDRAHELERGLEGYAVCFGGWAVEGRRLYRVIRAVRVSPAGPPLR